MHIVLIETSGNQDYIFSTNKLRENVGASHLIWLIGQLARELAEQGSANIEASAETYRIGQLAHNAAQQPIGHETRPHPPVVIAASGKALLLVESSDVGKAIVREVTRRVQEQASGIDVRGAISPAPFAFDRDGIHLIIQTVYRRHGELRATIPGPLERFLRLPVITECTTSGLPAARLDPLKRDGEKPEFRSAMSWAKRQASAEGLKRMRRAAGDIELAQSVDKLDQLEAVDWLAVIHADGNGLGQIFLDFDKLVGNNDNQKYISSLRAFSQQLDHCTEEAFRFAVRQAWSMWERRCQQLKMPPPEFLPMVPLVLGGDDLTVVCDGRLAVPFTVAFLEEFERQTTTGLVGDLAARREATPVRRLAACAGVAIVKPHFPFFAAYSLAEALLRSAKIVKSKVAERPCSAFDFHILYDASGADLERIRAQLSVDTGTTCLTARPYVVTPLADLYGVNTAGFAWAERRHVKRLRDCLASMQARADDGRRRLPNSMLHELRESLFFGRDEAEARLKLTFGRYQHEDFGALLVDQQLFWNEPTTPGEPSRHCTALLDAMDLAEFWEQENHNGD